jgi:hypothetical protein
MSRGERGVEGLVRCPFPLLAETSVGVRVSVIGPVSVVGQPVAEAVSDTAEV